MTILLTDEQVEAQYNLKKKTLANWRVKGDGPNFVKLGGAVRYRPEDLDAWIQSHVFSSTAQYRQCQHIDKNN